MKDYLNTLINHHQLDFINQNRIKVIDPISIWEMKIRVFVILKIQIPHVWRKNTIAVVVSIIVMDVVQDIMTILENWERKDLEEQKIDFFLKWFKKSYKNVFSMVSLKMKMEISKFNISKLLKNNQNCSKSYKSVNQLNTLNTNQKIRA